MDGLLKCDRFGQDDDGNVVDPIWIIIWIIWIIRPDSLGNRNLLIVGTVILVVNAHLS